MASAAKRPTGLAVKRDVAQRKERASYGARREEIVKSAGLVLKQHGLSGTTIEAIAKEAGVDRATIYYYFADKGAIFGEAIHGGLVEMVAALEKVAALDAVVRDGLRQGIFQTSLPPKVFAKTVAGMLNWTSRWFVPGGILDADEVADSMADTILDGVLVKKAAWEPRG
jgi:AcrR family transcriptional regulator